MFVEDGGELGGVFDGLAGALAEEGGHAVGGVAEEGDSSGGHGGEGAFLEDVGSYYAVGLCDDWVWLVVSCKL